ncbi:MAG TPA: LLM class flavin-dependent oxidoreductase [Flavobacteriales bacterium]
MELGISMFGDVGVDPTVVKLSPSQRLSEMLEQVKLADEVGLDVFEVGEHHREDYAITSPQIFLSAAAAITKKIKLGSAVTVLSSTDPVRVYEDFAMVDNISKGRVHIMAGRGSFIESFPLFGFELHNYDVLFEEKLAMLLEIQQNKGKNINWQGKFTQRLNDATIYPETYQEHIPVWIAVGGTPNSVLRAARLGLPITFAIIGGAPYNFKPLVDYYKENYKQFGHDPAKMQVAINSHTFIGATEEIKDTYYPYYAAQINKIGRERGWSGLPKQVYLNSTDREGAYFIGEPNAIIDKILLQHEWFGHTRFVAQMDVGAPSHSMIMKSIELFGTVVAPAVRKALAK